MPESRGMTPPAWGARRTARGFIGGALLSGAVAMAAAGAASANTGAARTADLPPSPAIGLARITGGLKAGASFSQHQGIEDPRLPYTVDSEWRQGFVAGAFLYFPITDRFGLQQEILYVQKGSRQAIGVDILEIPTTLDVVYDLDYLEVPLLLRFVWWRNQRFDVCSLGGFAFALKLQDHYRLRGLVVGDEDEVPVRADADMDEVDIFDFAFVYGAGLEFPVAGRRLFVEYRFALSVERLGLPTYAYVPFGEDEEILIENDPVPLRNQAHGILLGIRF